MKKENYKIGIDVGGTFTDIIVYDINKMCIYEEKILTTNDNPQVAIIEGLNNLIKSNSIYKNDLIHSEVIHGTTLFTNSLISRTENPPALIVTKGAEDIIYTGKGNRYDPYDRLLQKPIVLVPKKNRFTISERILANGEVYNHIDYNEINHIIKTIIEQKIDSVAIVLLHSYKNNIHEKLIKKYIIDHKLKIHLSLSSEICPEIGEYDRLNTTCSNAYIQPIAENYLKKLSIELKNINIKGNLQLIWSDGGISSLKDSINNPIRLLESGPAGGALAISYLSKNNNHKKSIAFDMGGTTAKVCLINNYVPIKTPYFEYGRIHRNKPGSGITVKVPSIDMLEIGAGGGSISKIDDLGLIKVGPESAGSNPGPICYNLGGDKITITDINLLLGYLSDSIKLAGYLEIDKKITKKIVDKIASNSKYTPLELITGIRSIVNENMSQAIKLHVTEKGEDPREFILYAFGGAGPLHAYDICTSIGIKTIIVPNRAGILSSYGFLSSQVGLEKYYTYIKLLKDVKLLHLKQFISKNTKDIFKLIKFSKIKEEDFIIDIYLEMRYEGQGFDLSIKINNNISLNNIEKLFKKRYNELYGLSLNYNIQISSLKILINEKNSKDIQDTIRLEQINTSVTTYRKVWFSDTKSWVDCKILNFDNIPINITQKGPAIIESKNTTVVVGVYGNYIKNSIGDIKINILDNNLTLNSFDYNNPVNLEIILARIRSIADEADKILLKTSFSSAVRDGKDYSLVISDKNGKCVGIPTECMPLFITCMPRTIRIISEMFDSRLKPGDIILTNDPWIGSGHKSDVALISPIYLNNKLNGFIGTILHVADIGGTIGDFRAWDFYEEGLMIPPIKLYKSGKLNTELIEMISDNVRLPKLVLGDIFAMVSTINSLHHKIINLNCSIKNLDFCKIAESYSKRMALAFKNHINHLPKGTFCSELNVDGILLGDINQKKDIKLKVKITIDNKQITVDYRGSDKQRERQPINVPYSYTMADTYYALQYILFGDIPNIGTQYCPIKIIVDDNCILNAKKPVPVYARTRTGIHISSLINTALAKCLNNNIIAGCGHNVIFRASGNDVNGNYFAMTFMPKGGMGATGTKDGFDCTVYPTNCTMIQTEIAETRGPILIDRCIAIDTAGKGKYRGGSGQKVRITSLSDNDLQFSFRPNFIKNTPKGLNGGENGMNAEILINGSEQTEDPIIIKKYEYVEVRTAGGGGLESYRNRDKTKHMEDKSLGIYSD